jgi:hypothetical protein
LIQAAVLANAFTRMVRDHHDTGYEPWLETARATELRSFADGIDRDAAAVRAALTEPSNTSPVERHINRVKTIKRQLYERERANYDLLRQRVLAAACRASRRSIRTEITQHCYRPSTLFAYAPEDMWKNPAFADGPGLQRLRRYPHR